MVNVNGFTLCFTDGPGWHFSHDPLLVGLSYAIAVLGAFAGLNLAERLRCHVQRSQRWLIGSALVLGGTVWTMHFTAMLAVQDNIHLGFDPALTVASLMVAVAAAGIGFYITYHRPLNAVRTITGGIVLGSGVVLMHYIGMASVVLAGDIAYSFWPWLLSVAIGIGAATVALALSLRVMSPSQRVIAAMVMAAAVSSMHYSGMEAAIVRVDYDMIVSGGIDSASLAIGIAALAAALMILALVSVHADRRISAALDRELQTLRQSNVLLERTQREIVRRLCSVGEFRDDNTGQHVARIATLAHRLALLNGCGAVFAENLRAAAPLHDIGKIGIRDAILHKPGPLTAEEFDEMRLHTQIGARILQGSGLQLLDLAAELALSHHENWDGSGYPHGLAGEQIPLSGRIIAICDVFDALLSRRPYKEPWPLENVAALLRQESGKRFDPNLIILFLRHLTSMAAMRTCEADRVAAEYASSLVGASGPSSARTAPVPPPIGGTFTRVTSTGLMSLGPA